MMITNSTNPFSQTIDCSAAFVERVDTLTKIAKSQLHQGAGQCILEGAITRVYTHINLQERLLFFITCGEIFAGFGDFFNIIKTALILRKHFPSCKLLLAAPDNDSYQKLLRLCDDQLKPSVVPIAWVRTNLSTYTRHRLYSFDVACPTTQSCTHKNHLHVDEYNGWRSVDNSASCNSLYSAGVGFTQSLHQPAVGMHLVDQLPGSELSKYENLERLTSDPLRKRLLYGQSPFHYLEATRLYFGYNSSSDSLQDLCQFLCTLKLYELKKEDCKDYDIVIVFPDLFDQYPPCSTNFPMNVISLKDLVEEVYEDTPTYQFFINSRSDACIHSCSHTVASRRVRLFFIDQIPHKDMTTLLLASEPITLSTGDQSLAEVISAENKIIFYQKQPWKEDLINQITAIAVAIFGAESVIAKFMKDAYKVITLIETDTVERTSEALSDPTLLQQFIEFNRFLKRHFTIDDWLIGKVKQDILLLKEPTLKEAETRILSAPKRKRPGALAQALSEIHQAAKRTKTAPQKLTGQAY